MAQHTEFLTPWQVSHETIYCALYTLPWGAAERIASLRKAHQRRRSRTWRAERRGILPNMISIHGRPIEAAARQVPGYRKDDLIKSTGNRSAVAVGTLVERKIHYLLLAKMREPPAAPLKPHPTLPSRPVVCPQDLGLRSSGTGGSLLPARPGMKPWRNG